MLAHRVSSHFDLVHVTPTPIFARFERFDNGVLAPVEVFGGMPVRRAVTTSHVPAREAQAQMHPACADLQAIFASVRTRFYFVDLVQVSAFRHRPSKSDTDVATFIGDSMLQKRPRLK